MTFWLYGDDATWYAGDSVWDAFSGKPLEEEVVKTMNLSPLHAAQNALERTRGPWVDFSGGRWKVNEDLEAVILQPPGNLPFEFVFHYGSVKLFRSREAGSSALISTPLNKVIEPARRWIHAALASGIPGGRDLIDRERGDTSGVPRAVTVQPLPPKPTPAPAPAPAPVTPTAPAQEIRPMALLDVAKKTKKVTITQNDMSTEVDRSKLLRMLRAHGATDLPNDAVITISLVDERGAVVKYQFDEDTNLLVSWGETKEVEETG